MAGMQPVATSIRTLVTLQLLKLMKSPQNFDGTYIILKANMRKNSTHRSHFYNFDFFACGCVHML